MRKFILALFYLSLSLSSFSQVVNHRIILIGDAGEINIEQQTLIHAAAKLIIPSRTTTCFLGDNIYPNGMGLFGDEKSSGEVSLRAQYESFRHVGVPVYFIAGNHDWDVSRELGLQKVIAQDSFLRAQQDEGLQFVPKAGTPGPFKLVINESLDLIFFDSEYFLFPHHEDDDLFQKQKNKFLVDLDSMVSSVGNKHVFLISHHPMRSYGEHGLEFTWKQHIFPLTRLHPKLYIPLPIIGSLYPLWRGKWFRSAEDLPHPKYQHMVNSITEITRSHPNTLFIAGHDHGLQFIDDSDVRQIVSGSGSKTSFIKNGKNLLFKYESQGFNVIDCRADKSLHIKFYTYQNRKAVLAYDFVLPMVQ